MHVQHGTSLTVAGFKLIKQMSRYSGCGDTARVIGQLGLLVFFPTTTEAEERLSIFIRNKNKQKFRIFANIFLFRNVYLAKPSPLICSP